MYIMGKEDTHSNKTQPCSLVNDYQKASFLWRYTHQSKHMETNSDHQYMSHRRGHKVPKVSLLSTCIHQTDSHRTSSINAQCKSVPLKMPIDRDLCWSFLPNWIPHFPEFIKGPSSFDLYKSALGTDWGSPRYGTQNTQKTQSTTVVHYLGHGQLILKMDL